MVRGPGIANTHEAGGTRSRLTFKWSRRAEAACANRVTAARGSFETLGRLLQLVNIGEKGRMQAFVMIPYERPFDCVCDVAIKPAVEDAGLTATVIRDEHYTGAIFERIQELIKQSKVCVADVTGGNPNVMWEAAYAHALARPVIFIAQGLPKLYHSTFATTAASSTSPERSPH